MNRNLSLKILSVLLVIATLMASLPLGVFAEEIKTDDATEAEVYIKEVKLVQSDDKDWAKMLLKNNGYTFYDANLNEGTDGEAIWLGYKTTTDPTEASYDMKLMNMKGGFTRTSMEKALESQKNALSEMASDLEYLMDEFVAALSLDELAHLLGGQPNTGVANTWGFGNLPQYNLPSAMTADGPAGLRIKPECGVNTTAFPCSTLLACTWDPEVTFAVGEAGAKEVKENNLAAWLTPAVNIHRSPLCGRNFEYYSEDPFLAGTMAAGMVKGIQSQHIAPSVKHFAINNKETNRKNSDSRLSERAAREIYLKVFEIIVKTAKPWYIMSSYNIINGHRASECRDLLTGILRDEWGFDGMVSTDWWTHGEHYKEVKAGNDLKMASGYPERLLAAVEAGVLTREEMETCVKRILGVILRLD